MYLLIDLDNLAVQKKTETYFQACAWCAILRPSVKHESLVAPLEKRTLAKFTEYELGMLYHNTFKRGVPPTSKYADLLAAVYDAIERMPADTTTQEILDAKHRELRPEDFVEMKAPANTRVTPAEKAPKNTTPKPVSTGGKRPAEGSVTGRCWTLADSLLGDNDLSAIDLKVFRASLVEQAVAQGIDPSTASTQFSRWKAAKLA